MNKLLVYSFVSCICCLFIGLVVGYALGVFSIYTPQNYQVGFKVVMP